MQLINARQVWYLHINSSGSGKEKKIEMGKIWGNNGYMYISYQIEEDYTLNFGVHYCSTDNFRAN